MARPTTGSITEHVGRDGRTYRSLRFSAYGKRRRVPLGPVSADEAERALAHAIADVERGTWRPPEAGETLREVECVPTFGEFGLEWWTLTKDQLAASTQADYWWRLTVHLAPYFNEMRLDAITFATIERYIAGKRAGVLYDKGKQVGEGDPLSARSINMTLTLLGAILERAVKRKLIEHNPARDKDLRVRERAPVRSYLDSAGQIVALLEGAAEGDRKASRGRTHVERRAMLAVLAFAGLRIGELCALRWRDVDLAGGWLHVGESKTDAGRRRVKIRGALRDELLALRGRHQEAPQAAYVFGTRAGGRMSPDNFRSRVLAPCAHGRRRGEAGDGAVGAPTRALKRRAFRRCPAGSRRTRCAGRSARCSTRSARTPDGHGRNGPHRPRARAEGLPASDAPRGEEKARLRALVEGGEGPERAAADASVVSS